GRHLVEQRLEQVIITPIDESHFDRGARQPPSRQQSAESSADDHHPMHQEARVFPSMRWIWRSTRNSDRFSAVSKPSSVSPSMTSAHEPFDLTKASERSMSGGTRTKARSMTPATYASGPCVRTPRIRALRVSSPTTPPPCMTGKSCWDVASS